MVTILVFALLLLSGACWYVGGRSNFSRIKRWSSLVAVATILLLYLVATGLLARPLLSWAQGSPSLISPEWKESNLIILLGMGTIRWSDNQAPTIQPFGFGRVKEAARLYLSCKQAGKSCQILTSGGDPGGNGVSEAQVLADELRHLSVNASDIIVEAGSRNTFENARFCAQQIKELASDPEQAFLVTSGLHMKRATLFFRHFGVDVIPSPADYAYAPFSLLPRAMNLFYADLALHEILGVFRFRILRYVEGN